MSKKSILFMLHCSENTGYAIASLERVFLAAATIAGYSEENIFWSYKEITTQDNPHIIQCDYASPAKNTELSALLQNNCIETVIAFDLGFPSPVIPLLKAAGVKRLISYWGASMSSINSGLKLKLKQIEYFLTRNKPDIFIFESEAMRKTATHGRGIQPSATDIICLGVDTDKFSANYDQDNYTYNSLNIPKNRKIVFYSGHMEERKGVRTIVNAAIALVDDIGFSDIHFVICGNKNREADAYEALLIDKKARDHVTFAGYRTDIAQLMRGCHIGVIASTGWDSFTMSSIEMMASGLPLIVSNLQGLSETIEDGHNGFLIPPGDHTALAQRIKNIVQDSDLAIRLSRNSRARAEKNFSLGKQVQKFAKLIGNTAN